MKREADVKSAVKELLNSFGARVWWFMPVPTGFGVQGVPDFVVCLDGQFFGIETKFGGNKQTPWQVKQQAAIHKAGGVYFVATEKNIDGLRLTIEAALAMEDRKNGIPDIRG